MSIALSEQQQSSYKKIYDDLLYGLRGMSSDDLRSMFLSALRLSFHDTVQHKKRVLQKTASFVKRKYHDYSGKGIGAAFRDDVSTAHTFVKALPQNTRTLYERFMQLPRENQIEAVASALLFVSIVMVVGGGSDFEGGAPDLDIEILGIGDHRNFFFHSVLLGFSLELTGRFCIALLEQARYNLPVGAHPVWDTIYRFLDNNKELAVSAMWLGISIHLLQDSGIFGGGTTPYKDLPFSMPQDAHNALFAVNGAVAGGIAVAGTGNQEKP